MKAKYFLDECIPIHWPHSFSLFENNYDLSISTIGPGVSDERILKHVIKKKQVLVTSDIRLALWSILESQDVMFLKRNGDCYFVKPESEKISSLNLIDPVTEYLSNKDEIIIP